MRGRFSLTAFLSPSWPLWGGEDDLSSRDFLHLVARRYAVLSERGLAGQRVGLKQESAISFLTNFLALLALDCETVLLPHYLTPAGLQALVDDHGLVSVVSDCQLADSPYRRELAWSEEDSRLVILTSGSQGSPKGVVHHWKNIWDASQNFKQHFGLSKLVWGQTLPLFHVAGLMSFFRPFCLRGQFVATHNFSPQQAICQGANVISLVPTQLFRLKECGHWRWLKRCELILVGGSSLGESLYRELSADGLPLVCSYGLSEMLATVAAQRIPHGPLSCGQPLAGREVVIDSKQGIWVGGCGQFLYYLEGKKLQRPTLDQGRFATADMGQWDERGELQLLGRKDDVFQCAGENIFPQTIERELLAIAGVCEAIVIGKSDEQYGAVPWAMIEAHPMQPEAYYQNQLRARLAELFIPRKILALGEKFKCAELKYSRTLIREHVEEWSCGQSK